MLTADGAVRASLAGNLLALAGADPVRLPCPGDWVTLRTWLDRRVTVEAVLPRRTVMVADGTGRARAANADHIAAVVPVGSRPAPARLAASGALARRIGAQTLVAFAPTEPVLDPAVVAWLAGRDAPVRVVAVSAAHPATWRRCDPWSPRAVRSPWPGPRVPPAPP